MNVLLGWELGGGLGHVRSLLPIADRLRKRGHRVTLALRDRTITRPVWEPSGHKVVAAPLMEDLPRTPFCARTFADILTRHRFAEPGAMVPLLDEWDALLDRHRVDVVVAEHAPTLALACFGSRPLVVTGSGFAVPAAVGDGFAPIAESAEPLMPDADLLAAINRTQTLRDRPTLDRLGDLFAQAARFPRVLPEVDPYRDHRDPAAATGPLHRLPTNRAADIADADKDDLFVYASPTPRWLGELCAAAKSLRLTGAIYLRQPTPALRKAVAGSGLDLLTQPQDLTERLPRTRVLVHHAGVGTSQDALACGTPQLVAPRHLEQKLTADCLASLGVAQAIGPKATRQTMRTALATLLRGSRHRDAAEATAAAIAARGPTDTLGRLCGEIERIAPKATTQKARPIVRLAEPTPPPTPKVFEIGLGRTGTTSFCEATAALGLKTIHWSESRQREMLAALLAGTLPAFLGEYDVVSDCLAMCVREVDAAYPGSRFVLTVRDEEAWYDSWVRHADKVAQRPRCDFLTLYRMQKFGCFEPRGNRERFLRAYRRHVAEVREYFADRPGDLLEMDICGGDGWEMLAPFLGRAIPSAPFPHRNSARPDAPEGVAEKPVPRRRRLRRAA